MNKVNILKLSDPFFPSQLKDIPLAPKQIYWSGADPNSWIKLPKIAIVGSRKVSPYGQQVTERLAKEAASAGIVIISGLALGVDSIAHKATLARGGITVAVLPTPLEKIYPASHANLARQIAEAGGSLISEYAKASPIYKVNFTYRNRIISGLADAVIITEAAARSGSLNTAKFALEQGKTIMAVPGNITSSGSEGTNHLIKSGATPVTSIEDILFCLNIKPSQPTHRVFRGSDQEQAILKLISAGVNDQEELALRLSLAGSELSGFLINLEINGYVRAVGGGQWIKS